MPDPFRHYEGAAVLDLPADPPAPAIPALDVLQGGRGVPSETGPAFLSQLLFYSAAISASKLVPSTGYRYALRVNPSSGNLHPTEFHFFTRGLTGWPDGLYHYRPSSHMAEQRAAGSFDLPSPVLFVLTSIAWREAWKYRSRAYRYCLHDIGHAWQAISLAANALGCDCFAHGQFVDDDIARWCRLGDDEWPMLQIGLQGRLPAGVTASNPVVWRPGTPNRLSPQTLSYGLIEGIHAATKGLADNPIPIPSPIAAGVAAWKLPPSVRSERPFGEVVRTRRSALDFTAGAFTMSAAQLSAILDASAQPYNADFGSRRFISLYLYVHRVDGLEPGVYRYDPETGALQAVSAGDQRVIAAGLSLGQDLAGNACVAFSMIADLAHATGAYGDRGYRYAHFEAGAIGHRMYLAAEAVGLRATGIGAFFDDRVHTYLDLDTTRHQVVYHFAIGYPIHDPRLDG